MLYGALSIGLDNLVDDGKVFCNADLGLLTGAVPLTLPPERTVVGVLETLEVNDVVIDGCRRLVSRGYAIALDDLVWRPGTEPLLELASIVKLDLLHTPDDVLADTLARCRQFDMRLLAEKVETTAVLAELAVGGFELAQGLASGT